MLSDNLQLVHQRIATACERGGRDPSSVTLVCVTKGIAPDRIREVAALGVTDFGENRVQEAREKQRATGYTLQATGMRLQPAAGSVQPVRWHLVGHLQRNKAKDAVELFEVIHSVDSLALAEELERRAATQAAGSRLQAPGSSFKPREVFIQVNVSGEATKFGCRPEEALVLAQTVTRCPHLGLKGLMTLAPLTRDPEEARPSFRRLRQLRDKLQKDLVNSSLVPGPPCTIAGAGTRHSSLLLSMGMSQDFEIAIEEGADYVRIGTAIFKNRD